MLVEELICILPAPQECHVLVVMTARMWGVEDGRHGMSIGEQPGLPGGSAQQSSGPAS